MQPGMRLGLLIGALAVVGLIVVAISNGWLRPHYPDPKREHVEVSIISPPPPPPPPANAPR